MKKKLNVNEFPMEFLIFIFIFSFFLYFEAPAPKKNCGIWPGSSGEALGSKLWEEALRKRL